MNKKGYQYKKVYAYKGNVGSYFFVLSTKGGWVVKKVKNSIYILTIERSRGKRFHPTRIENLKSPTLFLDARAMQFSMTIAAQRYYSKERAGNSNFYFEWGKNFQILLSLDL